MEDDQGGVAFKAMAHPTSNRFVAFLYQLMRDDVVVGRVEQIVRDSEKPEEYVLTNEHLARYAEELAERLGAGAR